eukprot:CAMPEP_0115757068 /NCGR_PEP_ID=MMETSP0272-20121206/98244_1 /TAXON_ID=71861 /ORGANISM="Scrippsiella trochoidea, Strain CCMP3099" /LENGTH=389 /DNA_ID=CAMNT_0003202593 /DNA_START=33 /DNA_END=1203 /DNA_ORIENTATION=+
MADAAKEVAATCSRDSCVPPLGQALWQTARRLLSQHTPIPNLQDCDPEEIEHLDLMLQAVELCGERLAAAITLLRSEEQAAAFRLASAFSACAAQLAASERHLETMQCLACDLRAAVAKADAAIQARKAAWVAKIRFDGKVERLKRHRSASGPSFVVEGEVSRKKIEQHTMDAKFQQATARVMAEAGTLLSQRPASIEALLQELRLCLAAAFGCSAAGASRIALLEAPVSEKLVPLSYLQHSMSDKMPPSTPDSNSCTGTTVYTSTCTHEMAPLLGHDVKTLQPAMQSCHNTGFRKGDEIEIWSSAHQAWFEGLVDEVFERPGVDHSGSTFPPGCLKISFAGSTEVVSTEEICNLVGLALESKCGTMAKERTSLCTGGQRLAQQGESAS